MGEKSVQKKRFILETARKVFVEKGFKKTGPVVSICILRVPARSFRKS